MANLQVVVDLLAKDEASGPIRAVESALGRVGAVSLAALATGVAGLGAGLGYAATAAANFDQTMSGVKAVSGATAEQMSQLSSLALQLGKETVFSANAAGQGLEELVKSGVSIEDIMGGAAKATLNLASAGGVDLVTAAGIASNALNSFNLKGADMAHVSDVIAGAANASAIDVNQFGLAMAQSSAVAATVGVSFDDLSVAIAEMGNAGIKGQDAGTSLKTMLLTLTPNTKQAATEMRALGIITADGANQFFDAQGHAKGLADISDVLQTATRNLTDQQKLQALQTIFGTDAIRAASVMAKNGAEGFDSLADSMSKVTAESVAAERLNNLKGDIEQLKGSVETAAITLGEALQPSLRKATEAATDFLNNGVIPFVEQNGPDFASALDTAAANTMTFADTVKNDAQGALQSFRENIGTAGASLAPWAAQAGKSGDAVSEALTGVSGVALGLQELLQGNFKAAAKDAGDGLGHLGTAASEMADVVKDRAIGALDDFRSHVDDASAALAPWAAEAGEKGKAVVGALSGVNETATALEDLLKGDFSGAARAAGTALDDFKTAAQHAAAEVRDDLQPALEGARGALQKTSEEAGKRGVWDDLTGSFGALKKAGTDLSDTFGGLLGALTGGRPTVQGSGGDFNLAAEMLKSYSVQAKGIADGAGQLAAGVKLVGDAFNTIGQAADNAGGAVQRLKNLIASGGFTLPNIAQEAAAAGAQVGTNIGQGLVDGIRGQSGQANQAGASLGQSAVDGAANQVGAHSPAQVFIELGHDIGDGLGIGLKSKNPDVRAAAVELARQAQIAIQVAAPVDSFLVQGQDMGEGISLGLLRAVPKAKTAAQTMGDSILNEMQSFTRNVDNQIQSAVDKLGDIQTTAARTIQSALDKEADAIDSAASHAQDAISKLVSGTQISTDTSGRRNALQQQIADEERAHALSSAADEAAYQHRLDLAQAEAKFNQDLAAATTAIQRAAIQARYNDQVASLNQSYADAQVASKHKQELDAADRQFKTGEDAKMARLTQDLQDETMGRQIADAIKGQIAQSAAAQGTYTDAVQKAQLTADSQRLILLRSYTERIDDLRTQFLDKIPPLEGPALDAFNAFMDNITTQSAAMQTTIADAFGTVVTAAQQAFGEGGDVPSAFNVTDRVLDEAAGKSRSVLGVGGVVPSALQATASSARQALGTGGAMPTAAGQAATSLDAVRTAAGPSLQGVLETLKTAAAGLGKEGFQVAEDAAKNLEGQFPGLTSAVDAWIATLGGIPKTVTTDIVTNFITNGSPSGGGGGGGGGSSSAKYAGQGSAGQYILPDTVHGGSVTVSGDNLQDAINNAAKQTGATVSQQEGGGTFGSNSNPSLAVGGITTKDLTANLHANEAVMPLDRLNEWFVPVRNYSGAGSNSGSGGGMSEAQVDRFAEKVAEAVVAGLQGVSLNVGVSTIQSALFQLQRRGGQISPR